VFTIQPTCWHTICNAERRGEHMSDKTPIHTNKQQYARQQEKLRIAREALARVEAKYARKGQLKHPLKPDVKLRVQQLGPK
jgi:hypothetical protein